MALSALDALNQLKVALIDGGLQTPAEGFMTAQQWAQETGQSVANVTKVLRASLATGAVEEATYRVRIGRIARTVTHYRVKPVPVSRNKK